MDRASLDPATTSVRQLANRRAGRPTSRSHSPAGEGEPKRIDCNFITCSLPTAHSPTSLRIGSFGIKRSAQEAAFDPLIDAEASTARQKTCRQGVVSVSFDHPITGSVNTRKPLSFPPLSLRACECDQSVRRKVDRRKCRRELLDPSVGTIAAADFWGEKERDCRHLCPRHESGRICPAILFKVMVDLIVTVILPPPLPSFARL